MVFTAVVLLMIGAILLFIPGPGIPFIIIGVGILGEQFRVVASALDSFELQLRKLKTRAVVWWRQASIPGRGAVALLAAVAMAGVGYGVFQAFFRG